VYYTIVLFSRVSADPTPSNAKLNLRATQNLGIKNPWKRGPRIT